MKKDIPREKQPKAERFEYEKMRQAATHPDPTIRKRIFIEYFERFAEFPSYLFDNQHGIDPMLQKTIDDIRADVDTPKNVLLGLDSLMMRLPS